MDMFIGIVLSYVVCILLGYFVGRMRSREIAKMNKKEWASFRRNFTTRLGSH